MRWAFCAAVLLSAGCSEVVTTAPPVEGTFTFFGLLNPTADTQAVIVYPIEPGTLQPIGPELLDAVVTSTDLETGEVRVWRDSVVADRQAGHSHVFWSDFRAEFGHTYELEAMRSDGHRSSVVMRVPVDVNVEIHDEGRRWTTLTFPGDGFRLLRTHITYEVKVGDTRTSRCPSSIPAYHYTFTHTGLEHWELDGWSLPLDLGQYVLLLESFYNEDYPSYVEWRHPFVGMGLVSLTLDVTIGDETWDATREIRDLREFSHPWFMTNVENGFGFLAAGYRRVVVLEPSPEAVRHAGFVYCE